MKKFIFMGLMALSLVSCQDKYSVQLSNGSKITAIEDNERIFKRGDTVCVFDNDPFDTKWAIDATGTMMDTTFFYTWKDRDSATHQSRNSYRIGTIICKK